MVSLTGSLLPVFDRRSDALPMPLRVSGRILFIIGDESFSMLNYAAKVRESIRQHGFHVTYVGQDETPSFCYSTGIFETLGLPELFLSSLPPNLSHELICQYAERYRDSKPTLGRRVSAMKERFDHFLIPVDRDALREYTLASFEFYGDAPFECLQLVYPDPDL
ncbi:MAG: DUF4262 domain-containing protein, partial [Planctomycetota bacterium]